MKHFSVVLGIIAIMLIAVSCSKKDDSGPGNTTQDQPVVFNVNTSFPAGAQVSALSVQIISGSFAQSYPISIGTDKITLTASQSQAIKGQPASATLIYDCSACLTVNPGATISIPAVGTSNHLSWSCSPCTTSNGVKVNFYTSFPSDFTYSSLAVVIGNFNNGKDTSVVIGSPSASIVLPESFAQPGQHLQFILVIGPSGVVVVKPSESQEVNPIGQEVNVTWTMVYPKK